MTVSPRSPSWPATTRTAPGSPRTPPRRSRRPGVEVVLTKIYEQNAQTFDAEVGAVKAANPEAVLLIAFDEASKILTKMVEQGIGPKDIKVYGTDGFIGNSVGENFDAGK